MTTKLAQYETGIFWFDCILRSHCYSSTLFLFRCVFNCIWKKDINLLRIFGCYRRSIWHKRQTDSGTMYNVHCTTKFTHVLRKHICSCKLPAATHYFSMASRIGWQINDADFCCGWRSNWIFRLQVIKSHFNDFYWLHVARVTIEQQIFQYIELLIKIVLTINISIWVSVLRLLPLAIRHIQPTHTHTL